MAQRGLVSGKEGIWFGKWEEQAEGRSRSVAITVAV